MSVQHRLRVQLLYKRTLKNMFNWIVDRELYLQEIPKVREMFEVNRNVKEPRRIEALLLAGEEKLADNIHPDPYIIPWQLGGSKYARNPPPPEDFRTFVPWRDGPAIYEEAKREVADDEDLKPIGTGSFEERLARVREFQALLGVK